MSFHPVGGPIHKKTVSARKKPGWDSSVNDLTAYRATPEEIMLRKEAHKSKNHISVNLENMRKENKKSKLSGTEVHKLAIMKEVLYDQQQLQKVLAKSDSMMAVIKDIFGDDPKRFAGFPNVTVAPKSSSSASNSLVSPVPDIYTRTEKLSDSVMSSSAINDIEFSDSDQDDEEEVETPDPISYEPKLNLQKFQQFLFDEEQRLAFHEPQALVAQQNQNTSNKMPYHQPPSGREEEKVLSKILTLDDPDHKRKLIAQDPQILSLLMAAATVGNKDGFQTPTKSQQGSQHMLHDCTPPSAINGTKKVKKTKKRIVSPDHSTQAGNTSMGDMRKALKDLEKELSAYEYQAGKTVDKEDSKPQTFSGYTVALVTAVSRLTRYLKEFDLRLRTEVALREQLTQDVYQLRTIIDALATDIIMTQEEYAKLHAENKYFRENTTTKIQALNNQMSELKQFITGQSSRPTSANYVGQYDAVWNEDNSVRSKTSEGYTSTDPMHKEQECQTLIDIPSSVSSTNSKTSDLPRLTQFPPAVKTVSVPRPIPLVQSNIPVPLTSSPSSKPAETVTYASGQRTELVTEQNLNDLVKLGDQTQEQLNHLQELAVEEALKNPELQDLMQTQIVELNRQQEEARKRLQNLLANQKLQQQQLQQQLGSDVILDDNFSPLNGHSDQAKQQTISPPISPISQGSGRHTLKNMENLPQVSQRGRGIILSLPMVDLDVSNESLS